MPVSVPVWLRVTAKHVPRHGGIRQQRPASGGVAWHSERHGVRWRSRSPLDKSSPGEPPQLTSCKKCLLITKVQIRSALKMASSESLNRSRALTFRLGQDGGLLSLYAHQKQTRKSTVRKSRSSLHSTEEEIPWKMRHILLAGISWISFILIRT
ncbi:hypothetical protein DPX16_22238 [Anabarilius grahami]|uniref:Uncharacterized protein n=1 Tax=Anabarilius grahami TaxID=495550 RepID=A0A3N0XNR6_ANAGA|nr:hypothetical protein DPX16_22238 [Anabarilius grahami]